MAGFREHRWVSPRRFAATTGIPLSTVYGYIRKGWLEHIRKDGRIWISEVDLGYWSRDRGGHAPQGVAPRRYRDERGEPLQGEHACPRSELLWGTAGMNVERAIKLDFSPLDLGRYHEMPQEIEVVETDFGPLRNRFLH